MAINIIPTSLSLQLCLRQVYDKSNRGREISGNGVICCGCDVVLVLYVQVLHMRMAGRLRCLSKRGACECVYLSAVTHQRQCAIHEHFHLYPVTFIPYIGYTAFNLSAS